MDPELKYANVQLTDIHPQLLPIIYEEPDKQSNTYRRESIALHPTCECNCCCYFCCGCPELYTPLEMQSHQDSMTLCPMTSCVVNPVLTPDTTINPASDTKSPTTNPTMCLFTPLTLVIDLITFGPRCVINLCSR
jgi:hypothetical protein